MRSRTSTMAPPTLKMNGGLGEIQNPHPAPTYLEDERGPQEKVAHGWLPVFFRWGEDVALVVGDLDLDFGEHGAAGPPTGQIVLTAHHVHDGHQQLRAHVAHRHHTAERQHRLQVLHGRLGMGCGGAGLSVPQSVCMSSK